MIEFDAQENHSMQAEIFHSLFQTAPCYILHVPLPLLFEVYVALTV